MTCPSPPYTVEQSDEGIWRIHRHSDNCYAPFGDSFSFAEGVCKGFNSGTHDPATYSWMPIDRASPPPPEEEATPLQWICDAGISNDKEMQLLCVINSAIQTFRNEFPDSDDDEELNPIILRVLDYFRTKVS